MDRDNEIWRPVIGYEGVYEVSSLGRIKRIARTRGAVPGRILKSYQGNRPYVSIILTKNCSPHTYSLHRIVAEAFHGPCPDGYEANHKNGITSDNRACNLEWVTPIANMQHSITTLGRNLIGENHPMARLTKDEVLEIRRLHTSTKLSMSEIASRFQTGRANIWLIVHRRNWRHI